MKQQSYSKLLVLAFCCTLIAGLMAGCSGSDGSNGANGLNAPTTGTVAGTVTTAVGAVPLAGVTVTASPTVSGGSATTDAQGAYSMSIPGGSYTLTFSLSKYTSATANVNVANSAQTPANATLAEAASGKPSVTLVASGNNVGYGQQFTVTANATSPLGANLTYTWGTGATGSGSTATATSQTFSSALGGTSAPANDPYGNVAPFVQDNRFGVLPINADTRGTKSVSVSVSDGQGGTTTASVSVNSAAVQTGVRQVALGIPVYLNAGSANASNAVWSFVSVAPTSALTSTALSTSGTGTRNAWFTPDKEGAYVVSNGSAQITIYAGKFAGAISGGGYTTKTFSKDDPKAGMFFDTTAATWWGNAQSSATYTNWPTVAQASDCATCHNNGFAINPWTSWQDTAHATFFARGIEGITSNSASCVTCHTVGSDGVNVGNGGYDDLAASTGFVYNKSIGAWAAMTSAYPTVARVSNIQCESCHGAQGSSISAAGGHMTAGTGGSSYVSAESSPTAARVSFSADVCGSCHSSGTGHHIYSEWKTLNPDTNKGHSNFSQFDATGYSGHAQSTNGSCARCHTAQGFVVYVSQLASGNAGTIPASSILWDKSNAQPQTCTACHDPHDATNEHQLRITGSLKSTMAGFGVSGVGKGALCMACHNNRNGIQCASAPTTTGACPNGALSPTGATFLHEDAQTNGAQAAVPASNPDSYLDSMHDASQTEVLMGRDFFFMGNSLPMISKHANVEDTCVGCHMELNPRTHLSHGTPAVNTHNFFIADADVATLCSSCHGNGTVNGEALQTYVEDQLDILAEKMSANMLARLSGTIYVGSAHTQLVSYSTITYNDGSFYITGLMSDATTTTKSGSLSNITTDAAGTLPFFGPSDILKKGSWNWTMIERDGSKGVHNPTLIQQVLTNTIAQF